MERICPNCGSDHCHSKGYLTLSNGEEYKRFVCLNCKTNFKNLIGVSIDDDDEEILLSEEDLEAFEPSPNKKLILEKLDFEKEFPGKKGFVVTSALNDTQINLTFFNTLKAYCEARNFQLMIIKNRYINPTMYASGECKSPTWNEELRPHFIDSTIQYKNVLKVIGDCNIQATATHPLTGIDGLSEGMTTIVGHPILQFKSVPVNKWRNPLILTSTGSISDKSNYSATKAGYRASFHHTYGATVVEFGEDEEFFIRQLLADKKGGFYDLDNYYLNSTVKKNQTVDAVVLGDEHVLFQDPSVKFATFSSEESIINVLKPKYIVRHDVVDSYSISHHHEHSFLTKYKKNLFPDRRSIETELNQVFEHIIETTPKFSKTIIVESNHHDHVQKWLNSADPKLDLVNAKFYHKLMYLVLECIEKGDNRSAFQIAAEEIFKLPKSVAEFPVDCFSLHDIELSMHGDRGPNGARGSLNNLSKIGERAVIGHSHTPGIQSGCWQVGTSSIMDLEYAKGPSSWLHTHCVVHKNGKRQLITIINGKWKSS